MAETTTPIHIEPSGAPIDVFNTTKGLRQVVVLGDSAGNGVVDPASGALPVSGPVTDTQLRNTPVAVLETSGLVPKVYDFISLGYGGSNLTTVIYKVGGAGGTTVATLTLGYTGSTLINITRT